MLVWKAEAVKLTLKIHIDDFQGHLEGFHSGNLHKICSTGHWRGTWVIPRLSCGRGIRRRKKVFCKTLTMTRMMTVRTATIVSFAFPSQHIAIVWFRWFVRGLGRCCFIRMWRTRDTLCSWRWVRMLTCWHVTRKTWIWVIICNWSANIKINQTIDKCYNSQS